MSLREQEIPVELWYVHFGPPDDNMKKDAEMFNHNPVYLQQHVQLHVQFLPDLQLLFEEAEGGSYRIDKATIRVTHAFPQKGPYGDCMIVSVPGIQLANLYNDHGDRLFDRNVRLYLGERKGSVNAGIAATLTDDDDRENFWVYNNGITIVCDNFDPKDVVDQPTEISLRNFSIVNGCQTTVSLYKAKNMLTEQVQVLAKIISPQNQIVDHIIQFTNSQNKIRVWDVKSQEFS